MLEVNQPLKQYMISINFTTNFTLDLNGICNIGRIFTQTNFMQEKTEL